MFLIFCVSFFVGGLPHKKGVCVLGFFRLNHFDSKWWVKYLALFSQTTRDHYEMVFETPV